jgi:transposase
MTEDVKELQTLVIVLLKKVEELTQEVADLKHRLSKYENPKNSNNSSIPPSKDENRPRRKSLREKSDRKVGGQKGREGKTLNMVEAPDIIETHMPEFCNCCGNDISNNSFTFVSKRQIFDIPEIKVKVTEHQVFKKKCECGHETTSDFPFEANAPVSYGNNVESLIGYFHARQYIPFKRMQEIFRDIFNTPISEGGIHYLLNKLVEKSQPAYDLIKQKLLSNTKYAIGADETGMKVAGNKHWAWTWQNEEATFITITDNRAQRSITETFEDGFENSVLVHDCWASHFNTKALSHQVCTAHLLRDMNYLTELYSHKWSKICKMIFQSALKLKQQMSRSDYYAHNPERKQIEDRLDKLLNYKLPEDNKELIRFQKRLRKHREYLFTFLYNYNVPPDNNASERAIRNIKVKQKVSGQFKSANGAFGFAVLRSVTDTVIKNNLGVLNSLKIITNLQTD